MEFLETGAVIASVLSIVALWVVCIAGAVLFIALTVNK